MCHNWLLQRRAQQDARTPEKMKRNQSLVANGNLSLEEKKRKILRSLHRLEGLGILRPPQSENQILQMIAKVTARLLSAALHVSSVHHRFVLVLEILENAFKMILSRFQSGWILDICLKLLLFSLKLPYYSFASGMETEKGSEGLRYLRLCTVRMKVKHL